MTDPVLDAPWGYDVHTHTEVVPKPAPPQRPELTLRWHLQVQTKTSEPPTGARPTSEAPVPFHTQETTVQITADQQVSLSITGEDRYDNPVDITGDIAWLSSDDTIVAVTADPGDTTKAIAVAVGPAGTAAVTVTNDVDQDGTGDFQGSLAIDVVAGQVAEIVIVEGDITDKTPPE